MPSLRRIPKSPYWICVLTMPDGSRTCKSTKIKASQRTRGKAQAACVTLQDVINKTQSSEPIRNKEAVIGALFKALQQAEDGTFNDATARGALNQILESIGHAPMNLATIEEFLRGWIDSKTVTKAAGTSVRYRHTVDSFLRFLGGRVGHSLASLTPKDFESFRDFQIREGKSPATANMVVKTLRIPMNMARRQGLILTNPTEAVDLLPSESGTRSTFTREQIMALLNAPALSGIQSAKQAARALEWRGMILFGVCHGLRLGDAAALTWENVDIEKNVVRFFPQKTSRGEKRKAEEYPLHADVIDYLTSLKALDNPKAPLFPSLRHRPTGGAHGLSREFSTLMSRAGIVAEGASEEKKKGKGRRFFELGFHSLRHTAISEQANHGVAKEVRMKLSGHRSNIHERYTHHEIESLRAELDRVPSFLKTPTKKDPKS
jgi:integrase